MELLIPGLILVALMVYASTRIKRTAAAAFDPETIETDDFVIEKPDGFLHNLNADPQYAFEAYSKEYSTVDPKLRKGLARITVTAGGSSKTAAKGILSSGDVTEDLNEVIDGKRYRVIEIGKNSEDVELSRSYKLVEASGSLFQLEVTAVDAADMEGAWIETFIDSFRVK